MKTDQRTVEPNYGMSYLSGIFIFGSIGLWSVLSDIIFNHFWQIGSIVSSMEDKDDPHGRCIFADIINEKKIDQYEILFCQAETIQTH